MLDMKGSRRLLKLKQILYEETDENHELSTKELIEKLKLVFGTDVSFDDRAIRRDLRVLDEEGFEIVTNEGKYGRKLYSHQYRLFETYQLRLMVDAILSARFITERDKKLIIQKLKRLTSKHIAKSLPDPMILTQSVHTDYHFIRMNIDRAHQAIAKQRVLAYQYGKYNLEKEFVFNREGLVYKVAPYALIWRHDYYYLIGKFLLTNEFRHYRLDRMRHVVVTDEKFQKEELDIFEYVNQTFHMFAGEEARVTIQFYKDLMNVFIDRFGLDADIKKLDDNNLLLTTKAKLSPGLVSWILRWGHKVKVLSPDWLVEEVEKEIKQMVKLYE